MMMAGLIGIFCGGLTALAWWILQVILSTTGIPGIIEGRMFLLPLVLGSAAVIYNKNQSRKSFELSEPLADLAEEYHFGIQRAHGLAWFFRAINTATAMIVSGIFGVEGFVIESVTALIQLAAARFPRRFTKLILHDIEIRQILVDAIFAGSFSVALGAPFTGALLSLEALIVSGNRVRIGAFTSSLAAYGVWRALSSTFSIEHFGVVTSLFVGFKSINAEGYQILLLSAAAVLSGVMTGLYVDALSRFVDYIKALRSRMKLSAVQAVLAVSVLCAVTIFVTPDAFVEPWRQWQQMAWSHLTTPAAAVTLMARTAAFCFALSAFGSTGILTPVLGGAALLGYAAGNLIGMSWSLPLALSSAAAALYVAFGAPLAAATLILEVCSDGTLWWLSLLAVAGAHIVVRIRKGESLFSRLMGGRGLHLIHGRVGGVLKELTMKDAMVTDYSMITESASISEIQKQAVQSSYNVLVVLSSEDKEFKGLLTLDQLPNNADIKGISSRDLLDEDAVIVQADAPLEESFEQLLAAPALAVLGKSGQLEGLIFKSHVLALYHREVGRKALAHYASRTFNK